MAHQSLYRRYRPQRFSEVRGQGTVVNALRSAVAEDRVGHAYLFSGPRGTGKTSTARILAKALNCEDLQDGEPCTVCPSCVAMQAGTSYDLQELDAASNNKVEDVRALIERVALGSPGRTKVYILDEVHMLSAGASNALLKTLEEPPDHVVFVLATTDPQKVLPTIRSRTQHFEFHLLPADEMADHVRYVISDAGLDVDAAAVEHVLRAGGGSARDTLSFLDQAAAGGVGDEGDHAEALAEAVVAVDTAAALTAVAAATMAGRDPRILGEALLAHLRDVFLQRMGGPTGHLSDTARERVDDWAGRISDRGVTRALEEVGEALLAMRQAPDPRIPLEVALVRITRRAPSAGGGGGGADDAALDDLVARVARLEQAVAAGAATAPTPGGGGARSVEPGAERGARADDRSERSARTDDGGDRAPRPDDDADRAAGPGDRTERGARGDDGSERSARTDADRAGGSAAGPTPSDDGDDEPRGATGAGGQSAREAARAAARAGGKPKGRAAPAAADPSSAPPPPPPSRGAARRGDTTSAPPAGDGPGDERGPDGAGRPSDGEAERGRSGDADGRRSDDPSNDDRTSDAAPSRADDRSGDARAGDAAPSRADDPSGDARASDAARSRADGPSGDARASDAVRSRADDPSGDARASDAVRSRADGPSADARADGDARSAGDPSTSTSDGAPGADGGPTPDAGALATLWADRVVPDELRGMAKALFKLGRVVGEEPDRLTVGLPNQAHLERCTEKRAEAEAALARAAGREVRLQLVVGGDDGDDAGRDPARSGPRPSDDDPVEAIDPAELVDAPAQQHTGVDRVTEAFPGAQIVEQ